MLPGSANISQPMDHIQRRRFERGDRRSLGPRKALRAFGHQGTCPDLTERTERSSCTLVPHSETQSVLPHQGPGSSKTFRVFTY
jgi:hypothetical protein